MRDDMTHSESAHADPHAGDRALHYSALRNGLITAPIAMLLAITFATSAFIHGQLLSLGGNIWGNYNMLRFDMPEPGCDPAMDIDVRITSMQDSAADEDSLFNAGPADPKAQRRSLESQKI